MHELLEQKKIVVHPFVIGEIALGSLKDRAKILLYLNRLPTLGVVRPAEVLTMLDKRALYGCGIGYVDVHLIAATLLTKGASLWTRDKRLHAVAERLGIAARLTN